VIGKCNITSCVVVSHSGDVRIICNHERKIFEFLLFMMKKNITIKISILKGYPMASIYINDSYATCFSVYNLFPDIFSVFMLKYSLRRQMPRNYWATRFT